MVQAETQQFDYVVIGAGSGGIASARRAAQHGAKVCLIENRVIGGTCVNVGCVPKKVMFNLANWLEEAHVMKGYGVGGTESLSLDFPAFKAKRDAYVQRLNGIYRNMTANSGITYVEGTAAFVSDKVVKVQDQLYSGEHILIASGSTPEMGGFPGSDLCIDSDDFFAIEELPEKVVVIGGGYIGVELAQIWCALGVKVTLVVRSIILRFIDRDIIDVLMENLTKLGVELKLDSPHESVTQNEDGTLNVNLKSGESIQCNKCLVALGRPPNVEPLALNNTGVELNRGAIKVDEFQNTSVPGVYAIGDVTNQVTLTPVAIRAGRCLSERLFNGRSDLKVNYNNIATVIFSHPPIGTCGLSSEEAVKKFGEENVKTFTCNFTNMFYSPAEEQHKQKSFFKIVCQITGEDNTRDYSHLKVLGVHGIGKGIDEMM